MLRPFQPQRIAHENYGKPDYLLIEHLEKSAKLDNYSLDEAVANLLATVEAAKNETEHQHR